MICSYVSDLHVIGLHVLCLSVTDLHVIFLHASTAYFCKHYPRHIYVICVRRVHDENIPEWSTNLRGSHMHVCVQS